MRPAVGKNGGVSRPQQNPDTVSDVEQTGAEGHDVKRRPFVGLRPMDGPPLQAEPANLL